MNGAIEGWWSRQAVGITCLQGAQQLADVRSVWDHICLQWKHVDSNAPLCLNLSCWLYGNDVSQAKHNKPLASSACRQQRGGRWRSHRVHVRVWELDRHWECRLVYKYEAHGINKSRLNDAITRYYIKQILLSRPYSFLNFLVWTQSWQQFWFSERSADFRSIRHKNLPKLFSSPRPL